MLRELLSRKKRIVTRPLIWVQYGLEAKMHIVRNPDQHTKDKLFAWQGVSVTTECGQRRLMHAPTSVDLESAPRCRTCLAAVEA